jgi:hypothetical protein
MLRPRAVRSAPAAGEAWAGREEQRRAARSPPRTLRHHVLRGGWDLAPLLDSRIDDPELREKLAHHARYCAECNEELEIVKRALEP